MKDKIYRKYIGQLEATERLGYFFESAWISYVLLEDRLLSILRSSGGEHYPNGREIRMMGTKIEEIKKRMASNVILRAQLETDDLVTQLEVWKDERNILMHKMADGSFTIDQIEEKIISLAKSGSHLVRAYSAAARRIKK